MRRFWLIILMLCVLAQQSMFAHSGFEQHKADFYAVLGFEENENVTAWMKLISSEMIDDYKGDERQEYNGLNFYDYLKSEFEGFKCKHRLLFHWGYNSVPWNNLLQEKVNALSWGNDLAEVKRFKEVISKEQQRRNREANAMTEELFGFASGGKDASFANAMISIVYDVHLFGDYTPDNSDVEGVQDFRLVVGDFVGAVRKLDKRVSKSLVKRILEVANNESISVSVRAEQLIGVLTDEFPKFLKKARFGSLARRFERQGIEFK